jgi:hypothetical protein
MSHEARAPWANTKEYDVINNSVIQSYFEEEILE